jgi:hypothetical protein
MEPVHIHEKKTTIYMRDRCKDKKIQDGVWWPNSHASKVKKNSAYVVVQEKKK